MKEVLTKRFWQGVKKTFHDALEGQPPEGNAIPPAAADMPKEPSTPDGPRSGATSQENGSDINRD